MDDLIEALNIVREYMDDYGLSQPTGCEHDVLWLNVDTEKISEADLARLEQLSFFPDEDYADSLVSYKYGSC